MRFYDWWEKHSETIFKKVKEDEGLYEVLEMCWEAAETHTLHRCAQLSAHQLSWESQLDRAAKENRLREFLDQHKEKPGTGRYCGCGCDD